MLVGRRLLPCKTGSFWPPSRNLRRSNEALKTDLERVVTCVAIPGDWYWNRGTWREASSGRSRGEGVTKLRASAWETLIGTAPSERESQCRTVFLGALTDLRASFAFLELFLRPRSAGCPATGLVWAPFVRFPLCLGTASVHRTGFRALHRAVEAPAGSGRRCGASLPETSSRSVPRPLLLGKAAGPKKLAVSEDG